MQTAESLFAGPDNGNQNNVARHGGADQWLAFSGHALAEDQVLVQVVVAVQYRQFSYAAKGRAKGEKVNGRDGGHIGAFCLEAIIIAGHALTRKTAAIRSKSTAQWRVYSILARIWHSSACDNGDGPKGKGRSTRSTLVKGGLLGAGDASIPGGPAKGEAVSGWRGRGSGAAWDGQGKVRPGKTKRQRKRIGAVLVDCWKSSRK
ncbi:hypothetical protein J3E68DRAFT_391688 [Trichoderma sp. SZMC 28012]